MFKKCEKCGLVVHSANVECEYCKTDSVIAGLIVELGESAPKEVECTECGTVFSPDVPSNIYMCDPCRSEKCSGITEVEEDEVSPLTDEEIEALLDSIPESGPHPVQKKPALANIGEAVEGTVIGGIGKREDGYSLEIRVKGERQGTSVSESMYDSLGEIHTGMAYAVASQLILNFPTMQVGKAWSIHYNIVNVTTKKLVEEKSYQIFHHSNGFDLYGEIVVKEGDIISLGSDMGEIIDEETLDARINKALDNRNIEEFMRLSALKR